MPRSKTYDIDSNVLIERICKGDTIQCIAYDMKVSKHSLFEKIRELKKKYDANSLVHLVIKIKQLA